MWSALLREAAGVQVGNGGPLGGGQDGPWKWRCHGDEGEEMWMEENLWG